MRWLVAAAALVWASVAAPVALAPEASSSQAAPVVRLGRTTGVETIALDAYVAQVVAGEGQPRAAEAAQQALAIAARTYAVANRNRHRAEGFDLCDSTHCQVVRPATAATTRAAEVTSGRMLLHQGQPAFVFYSAWCGGQTELASQVWPGAIDYGAEPSPPRSLGDEACDGEPEWTSELGVADLEDALRRAGLRGSRLRDLRVLARNPSDRVVRLRVDGFTPPEISGHEFRMAVGRVAGPLAIKSTAFDVDRTRAGFRFRGRGFGHGVGLCVIGAGRRAARGASADAILRFYFPGLTVGPVSAPTTAATVIPSPAGDIALALPVPEERERSAVLKLLRDSREAIARLTGTTAPALRVIVHPTADSFTRATGQPWWATGSAIGSLIDLPPIGMLRRQGQLERAIRHEVTHAMLDAALAERPAWVREGAAAYFAASAPRARVPDRVPCPSDGELLRPISAGAHRDAYARAEACFARAIADGKRWNEVR